MRRIGRRFEELKKQNKKALIPFVVAGDPELCTTRRIVLSLAKNGADIIELGIPYSDPLADGPVNQRAAERALEKNLKISDIMEMVRSIRKESNIPLLYLVYFNCLLRYGLEKFLSDCVLSGIDGLVIPDLPYEERQNYSSIFDRYDIDIISLVAPTSKERLKEIIADAQGFIYCVTSTGVTGTRETFDTDFVPFMDMVAVNSNVPRALGFGISSPEQVNALKVHAEGIIIGSAIVKRIEESKNGDEAVKQVTDFIKEIRKVL